MKISKLFHWLYTILMLLPFGLLLFNGFASMWSGNTITYSQWMGYLEIGFGAFGYQYTNGVVDTICRVYMYLFGNVFGFDLNNDIFMVLGSMFTYWTCISIIWLIFDVFMYVPLLVHKWIDRAKVE